MLTKTLILSSRYPTDLTPPNITSHHRWRRTFTISLHVGSLLTSLVAISLFAAAIPRWNANFFHNSGPNKGDWTDGFALGPLTFALLYHAGVLIYDQVQQRRRQTPALPALSQRSLILHTTVTVLILVIMIPALFIAGYGSLFRFWKPAVRTQSGILVCNMLNVFARECEPVLYTVGSLQIGAIICGTLLWVLHFMLLLLSLRDMRRQRLVKQLQKEKLAQYDTASEKSARSNSKRQRSSPSSSRAGSRSNSLTSGESRISGQQQRNIPTIQAPAPSHTRQTSYGK
ncbi:hypothetical protein LTR84_011033 [Exophiala bonariae]|uniref:TLC domain-containing protein n=1 Tax=Exophiala bonariae TaxID=1690606 RepID=A0AAV9NME2_9EURO|nr:hypothetical protein LTR84_011033 [Exophiala bonariae]